MKCCIYNSNTSVDYRKESKTVVQYFMTVYFNTRLRFFTDYTVSFPRPEKHILLILNANFQ